MAELLLVLILAWAPQTLHPESLAQMYVDAAQGSPVDAVTLVAVSYHESRLRSGLVSRTGACGIMQVQPRFSRWRCGEMQTEQGGIAAGVEALRSWGGSLAHYGGGNRGSERYRRAVLRYRKEAVLLIADFLIERTPY